MPNAGSVPPSPKGNLFVPLSLIKKGGDAGRHVPSLRNDKVLGKVGAFLSPSKRLPSPGSEPEDHRSPHPAPQDIRLTGNAPVLHQLPEKGKREPAAPLKVAAPVPDAHQQPALPRGQGFYNQFQVKKSQHVLYEFLDELKEIKYLKDLNVKDIRELRCIRNIQNNGYGRKPLLPSAKQPKQLEPLLKIAGSPGQPPLMKLEID